jgi:hypothetical protein
MEEFQIVTIKEDEDMIISPDSGDCSEESVLPRYSTLHVSCFHDVEWYWGFKAAHIPRHTKAVPTP